ncbi:MAG: hypothetical protein IH795_01735 [Bacteroidetes bacterium]|jgi:hypothetical protein|nr:hypothetical protein [Bacteroidota bacterium]
MAAKVTVPNQRVYTHIGQELSVVAGTGIPDTGATMTNFKAIDANMADAGFLVIAVENVDYAIPLLLTT